MLFMAAENDGLFENKSDAELAYARVEQAKSYVVNPGLTAAPPVRQGRRRRDWRSNGSIDIRRSKVSRCALLRR
jgi:hypothetical protein